jgi:hypothetical protein
MVTTSHVLSLCPAIMLCEMFMQHSTRVPSLPRNASAILALCEFYKSKLEVSMGHLAAG